MSKNEESIGLRIARAIAESEATAAEFPSILPEHFWMALSRVAEMVEESAGKLLEMAEDRDKFIKERRDLCAWFGSRGIQISGVRRAVRESVGLGTGKSDPPRRSSSSKEAYRIAEKIAVSESKNVVTMTHLIQALHERPSRILAAVLGKELDPRMPDTAMQQKMKAAAQAYAQPERPAENRPAAVPPPAEQAPARPAAAFQAQPTPAASASILAKFGRDLVELAKKGLLQGVVGRKDELRRLAQILGQRQKCNALLVGDPGVGKTQLVEGLAHRIASADCPSIFKNRRIVEISLSSLVAGAQYRGDFEERLEGILKEAENDPNLILFIDEFHTAVGAGAGKGSGSQDASNILKPALGRGGIRVIGATTPQAYEDCIARDPALARRFDVIWVEEPTRGETLEILQGVKVNLETHHTLDISNDALEAAVDLSMRYLPERRLPDKAIDVLDQACAQRAIPTISPDRTRPDTCASMGREDIARVIAARTRIPLDLLTLSDGQRLNALEEHLNNFIFGQQEVMARIAQDLRSAYNGLRDPKRPIASFLFAGPTGVGKSQTAKVLAEYLFGQKESLIAIDLSEFSEKHQLARLIGAPPGYVGFQESGILTAALRRRPASVVLFDEIEKAHPDVLNILLQILDEGRLTDGQSRTASFCEAVVVMTSNIASNEAAEKRVGFRPEGATPPQDNHDLLLTKLAVHLRPELLGRIHTIVEFKPLSRPAIEAIVRKIFDAVCKRAAAQSTAIIPPEALCATIVNEIGELKHGARDIEKRVEAQIAAWMAQAKK